MKTSAVAVATALLFVGAGTAQAAPVAHASGKFESYSASATAVTYDAKVPSGAKVLVLGVPTIGGGTTVLLKLKGLLPHRAYGAHVHVNKCGATPAETPPCG